MTTKGQACAPLTPLARAPRKRALAYASTLRGTLALLAAMASASAAAHGLLLVPDARGTLVLRDATSTTRAHVDPDRLVELRAYAPGGRDMRRGRPLDATPRGNELVARVIGPGPKLVIARYDDGTWVRTRDAQGRERWLNASRASVPDAEANVLRLSYAKALFADKRDTDLYRRVTAQLLEIVPLSNPATMGIGETMPVLVRFNGEPLAGASVENGDARRPLGRGRTSRYRTDAQGVAMVPVHAGFNVLAVEQQRKREHVEAGEARGPGTLDEVVMSATYTFSR